MTFSDVSAMLRGKARSRERGLEIMRREASSTLPWICCEVARKGLRAQGRDRVPIRDTFGACGILVSMLVGLSSVEADVTSSGFVYRKSV